MNKNCLISVVLPVYNVEKYVRETIDTILNQTIQDFEIIVIDDCSTDNTLPIIKSIKDDRIRIIEKLANKGLIDSLNIGFKKAKGTFIARMDGDDKNAPNRFEKQLKVLQDNPAIKACGCWLQCFGTNTKIIKHKEFHDEIVAQMLLSCPMSMGSVMLDREAIIKFKFDENKLHVEDYDFWSRVAWSIKLYNIQEVLYYYRVHEAQVSNKYKSIQVEGDINIKLFLFKKLNYNTEIFSDELLKKILLPNQYITINEFGKFNEWIKELIFLNSETKIFSQKEFKEVLNTIKEKLFFLIYFTKTSIGITKKWRVKSLFRLDFQDVLWILNIKGREIRKKYLRDE